MLCETSTTNTPHLNSARSVCTPYQAPANASTPAIPDEELIRKYLPNFGYQLYFKQPRATTELEEVIEHFLQPMHSPAFRRRKAADKPEGSAMSSWVAEGKLEASVKRQIEAKRSGKLASPPPERVSDLAA